MGIRLEYHGNMRNIMGISWEYEEYHGNIMGIWLEYHENDIIKKNPRSKKYTGTSKIGIPLVSIGILWKSFSWFILTKDIPIMSG